VRRAALALALLAPLQGCLAYPRPYLTNVKGRADLGESGQPVRIEAGIVKTCDTINGEEETIKNRRGAMTDKDGRYSFLVAGLVWHSKSYRTLTECTSRIQRFICRPHCKKVDEIDIEMLGK
jgi:hypothetical protein